MLISVVMIITSLAPFYAFAAEGEELVANWDFSSSANFSSTVNSSDHLYAVLYKNGHNNGDATTNSTLKSNLTYKSSPAVGVYNDDGYFYLPNISQYYNESNGFKATWTTYVYDKGLSDEYGGVFALGTNYNNGNDGDANHTGQAINLLALNYQGKVYNNGNSGTAGQFAQVTAATSYTITLTYDKATKTVTVERKNLSTNALESRSYTVSQDPVCLLINGCSKTSYPRTILKNLSIYSVSGGLSSYPISITGYGCISTGTRCSGTSLTICDDCYDASFSLGYINFSVPSIDYDQYKIKSAEYTFTYTIASSNREARGLTFFYPKQYLNDFSNTEGANVSMPNAYKSTVAGHLVKAVLNNGLVEMSRVDTSVGQTNKSVTVDVKDAINYAIQNGLSYATVCIAISSPGGEQEAGGWTDTVVTVNKSSFSAAIEESNDGFDTSTVAKYKDPRRPADGTTANQPFVSNTTGGSQYFRIPGIVTMDDGSVVTLADARWNRTADGGGNDTVVSRSSDSGATWSYTFANYLSDNRANEFNTSNTGFCDSELATDGTNLWMLSTVLPAGTGLNSGLTTPSAHTIYTNDGHLYLAASTNGNLGSFNYCLGDFDANGFARIYNVSNGNIGTRATGTYSWNQTQFNNKDILVDENFNIYNKPAAGGDYAYQSNLFFKTTAFGVAKTCHLVLRKSTDGGKTWGAPKPLNVKNNDEYFYGVGPGRGVVSSDGQKIFFSAYKYAGASAQRSSLVYSLDGGKNWIRSSNAHESQCSESQVVILNENADGSMKLRLFFRSASETKIEYQDATLGTNGTITWGSVVTISGTAKKSDCQISAITYSKTIGGQKVIFVSTPSSSSTRGLGKIYTLFLNDDYSVDISKTKSYSVTTSTDSNTYMYSCMTELKDGRIALLYESLDGYITYKVFSVRELTGLSVDGSGADSGDAPELTGIVDYDPVIYTRGQDYRDVGSTISTGSATYEEKTQYRVKEGFSIKSIAASNDNVVSPSSNTGTGYLYGSVVGANETTNLTVDLTTTVVRNSDKKEFIQKDRLYVVTNPVPSNAACAAQVYTQSIFTVTGIWNDMFVSVADGSYPTYGNVSGNYTGNINNNGMTNALALETKDAPGDHKTEYIDIGTTKKAGHFECSNKKGSNCTVTATAATANYYLDTSVSSGNGHNRGISYTKGANSYSFNIIYLPQKNANGDNTITVNKPTLSSSSFTTNATSTTRTKTTGSKAYHKITSTDLTTGTKSVTYTMSESESTGSYTLNPIVKIPINVYIQDKSSLRNVYDDYVSQVKASDCYTEESWKTYSNALINAEEYLNKYDLYNTGTQSMLLSVLNSAYNGLTFAEATDSNHSKDVFTQTIIQPTCTEQGYTLFEASCGYSYKTDYQAALGHLEDVYSSRKNGTHDVKCSRCNQIRRTVYCTMDDGACTYCGYRNISYDAYDAAITVYNTTIAEADYENIYTEDSRNAYLSAYNDAFAYVGANHSNNDNLLQSQLDSKVAALTTAKENLAKNQFAIVVQYVLDDGTPVNINEFTKNYYYGDIINAKLPDELEGDVYSWKQEALDGDAVVGTSSRSFTSTIKKNAKYICYLYSNRNVQAADSHRVTLYKIGNKVAEAKTLPDGEYVVSISSNIIRLGSYEFEAEDPAFYEVKGFKVNGVAVENGNVVTIDENSTIVPIFFAQTSLNIDRADPASDIMINGKTSLKAKWDEVVTLTASNTTANTAWYIDDELVGYGISYKFRATQPCRVRYENAQDVQANVRIDYLTFNQYKPSTVTIVSGYTLPEDCTIVKRGVLLKTDRTTVLNQSYDGSTLYTGSHALPNEWWTSAINSTTGNFESKNYTATNQYTINVTRTNNTSFVMGAVAYVIYTDGAGTQHTIFSNQKLIAYKE